VHYVLPGPKGSAALRAENQAVESLLELRSALNAYAGTQRGAYPASLEVLGDRARASAQKALSEGYQLQYIPGPVGPDGAAHSYRVRAGRATQPHESFSRGETAPPPAPEETPAAPAQDPPI